MKRIAVLLSCGLVLLSVASAASAGVRITKIYFDSPGADSGAKSSLNAEWVRLRNTGSTGKYLTGWAVRDTASHVYRFGTYKLGAGNSVTVHTGSGSDSAGHRYWSSDRYVWNNDGDKATLKNAGGTAVDTCSYSGAGSYTNC